MTKSFNQFTFKFCQVQRPHEVLERAEEKSYETSKFKMHGYNKMDGHGSIIICLILQWSAIRGFG
ncbi:hypothetical protein ABKV19_014059 [Rosa sericea]